MTDEEFAEIEQLAANDLQRQVVSESGDKSVLLARIEALEKRVEHLENVLQGHLEEF